MSIVLPTKPVPALVTNPENLIIISKPKIGKSTLAAGLAGNLILDLERGTKFIEAMKVEANSVADIAEIGQAIIDAGKPYQYITIDTATSLEEICEPYAEQLYAENPGGKNWLTPGGGKDKYGRITNLPDGAGYNWTRLAYEKIDKYIRTWAPHVITFCHIKDIALAKGDTTVNVMEMDLTGKLKRIVAKDSDAIGYLYRKGNKNILSFKTGDDVLVGARPAHLRNQEIVVSEYDEKTGVVTTHWDRIFIK